MTTPERSRVLVRVLCCALVACAQGWAGCRSSSSGEPRADTCGAELLLLDRNNCGEPGRACREGEVCSGGTCVLTCTPGYSPCGSEGEAKGYCANLLTDRENCGACGRACAGGEACSAGACVLTCTPGYSPCDSGGQATRSCANLLTDPENCGACGHACAGGEACSEGSCATSCVEGYTACALDSVPGGEPARYCADLLTDRDDCGACGRACEDGEVCSQGVCATSCIGGYARCTPEAGQGTRDYCARLETDRDNCGECGHGCAPGEICSASTCRASCGAGQAECTGGGASYCARLAVDPSNCGTCGNVCPSVPSAAPVCVTGTCGFACQAGHADCNGAAGDGCEADLATSATHCGRCGNACPGECVGGACDPFPSTGAEGAFQPAADTVIEPGVHHFTVIHIPAGVRVTTRGNATLELRATGDVRVEGMIDLSGGRGGDGLASTSALDCTGSGSGGSTGNPLASGAAGQEGVIGAGGGGGSGQVGGALPCIASAAGGLGGGAGGASYGVPLQYAVASGGGGGGGYAGGGGGGGGQCIGNGISGSRGASFGASIGGEGGAGGSAGCGTNGAVHQNGGGKSGALGPALLAYAGKEGQSGWGSADGCDNAAIYAPGGGGGGGSIGAEAAADLSVKTTFHPGSGGGGGGANYDWSGTGRAGGGGGGGGALRIASRTRIDVAGSVLANGGNGGNAGPAPGAVGGGGGGSGGVIYLAAPQISVAGTLSAAGGAGGTGPCAGAGGAGGPGRIRLSVRPIECLVTGTSNPPLQPGCAESAGAGTPNTVFVGEYPN